MEGEQAEPVLCPHCGAPIVAPDTKLPPELMGQEVEHYD
jgi:hypothetical protein